MASLGSGLKCGPKVFWGNPLLRLLRSSKLDTCGIAVRETAGNAIRIVQIAWTSGVRFALPALGRSPLVTTRAGIHQVKAQLAPTCSKPSHLQAQILHSAARALQLVVLHRSSRETSETAMYLCTLKGQVPLIGDCLSTSVLARTGARTNGAEARP